MKNNIGKRGLRIARADFRDRIQRQDQDRNITENKIESDKKKANSTLHIQVHLQE